MEPPGKRAANNNRLAHEPNRRISHYKIHQHPSFRSMPPRGDTTA
jgi:hypothetical protein